MGGAHAHRAPEADQAAMEKVPVEPGGGTGYPSMSPAPMPAQPPRPPGDRPEPTEVSTPRGDDGAGLRLRSQRAPPPLEGQFQPRGSAALEEVGSAGSQAPPEACRVGIRFERDPRVVPPDVSALHPPEPLAS